MSLSLLKTFSQWNALNAIGICSSSSTHHRFQEWRDAGILAMLHFDTASLSGIKILLRQTLKDTTYDYLPTLTLTH